MAYGARDLRTVFRDGNDYTRPIPAAVILDMSTRALDPQSGSNWERLYTYVFGVIAAVDEPPFPAESELSPDSPQVAQRLREFRQWYETRRASLEALAAQQKPELEETQRVLAGSEKCR